MYIPHTLTPSLFPYPTSPGSTPNRYLASPPPPSKSHPKSHTSHIPFLLILLILRLRLLLLLPPSTTATAAASLLAALQELEMAGLLRKVLFGLGGEAGGVFLVLGERPGGRDVSVLRLDGVQKGVGGGELFSSQKERKRQDR